MKRSKLQLEHFRPLKAGRVFRSSAGPPVHVRIDPCLPAGERLAVAVVVVVVVVVGEEKQEEEEEEQRIKRTNDMQN
ncbi:hypothetical protein E2C01_024874 [Portunus trituberculatus]|uniref:Uncharacterized protein n=1 Tax=Portunus trituberculatus TaxID=210409 RepID=A0A5B7EBE9_PORTR|nr:hypothetical protein [Portunus trituberculatus]